MRGGRGGGADKREFSFSSASHFFAALLSVGSRLTLLASPFAGRIKVVFLNNPTRLTDKDQLSGPQDHPLDHSLAWCRHQVFEVRWTTFTFEQNHPLLVQMLRNDSGSIEWTTWHNRQEK